MAERRTRPVRDTLHDYHHYVQRQTIIVIFDDPPVPPTEGKKGGCRRNIPPLARVLLSPSARDQDYGPFQGIKGISDWFSIRERVSDVFKQSQHVVSSTAV